MIMVVIKYVLYKSILIQWPIQHPKTFATVLEKLWFIKKHFLTHKIPVGSIVNRVPVPWDIRPPVCPTFMMFAGQYCVPDAIYKERYTIYKYSP